MLFGEKGELIVLDQNNADNVGGTWAGARQNRGREGYGRPERKGREVGVPKGLEAGEIGENYATLHDISQSKKGKTEEAKKKRGGSRDCKVREAGGLDPPVSPPPPTIMQISVITNCNKASLYLIHL